MSFPFLRPSPPPSTMYLRSFLRGSSSSSSSIVRSSWTRQSRQLRKTTASSYSTATSPPSKAVPTGSPPASDTKATSAPAPSSTASVSSPPPIPASAASASSSQTFERLPYHVHRTASQGLPVYHDKKAGGTLKQTLVRKVEGDKDALRQRLLDELPALLKPEHVRINRLTGHIVIKGHVAREVAGVLRGLHF